MDFGLRSANRREGNADTGWSDITTLLFKRHGRYDFGLTLQGFFVRPASQPLTQNSSARKAGQDFHLPSPADINFDDDVVFGHTPGLRDALRLGVRLESQPRR